MEICVVFFQSTALSFLHKRNGRKNVRNGRITKIGKVSKNAIDDKRKLVYTYYV